MGPEATDHEIQKWVERQFGFTPETGWIAHCLEFCGPANVKELRIEQPVGAPWNVFLEHHCGLSFVKL
jgi:hypothetical protein